MSDNISILKITEIPEWNSYSIYKVNYGDLHIANTSKEGAEFIKKVVEERDRLLSRKEAE